MFTISKSTLQQAIKKGRLVLPSDWTDGELHALTGLLEYIKSTPGDYLVVGDYPEDCGKVVQVVFPAHNET